MSKAARIKAALFVVRNLPTEDIERVNVAMPNLADCAFNEILNPPNTDLLRDVLIRYEGAVSTTERDGDDSDEALAELEQARTGLLKVLKEAREKL